IVEMLIRHPAYTPNILAKIVVDALEYMQAEFAFELLNRASFRDRALNPALHEAAGRVDEDERYRMVKELIRLGADPSSCDQLGRTALEIARSVGNPDPKLIKLLQAHVQPGVPATSEAEVKSATPAAITTEGGASTVVTTDQPQSSAKILSTNAERLLHHAVALCASSNRRNLEEQLETLAKDCLALPEEERLRIVLRVIKKIVRNKDDIVQGKALPSLEVMIDSLSGEARAEGLQSFCGSFDKFAKELPWAGIVKQSMAWAKEFDPKTNAVLCGKIASVLDHFRPGVRSDVVEALLDQARAFSEADRVELMRVFAQNVEHLFKKSSSSAHKDLYETNSVVLIEKTFCKLVKQCNALKPENAAMILVILYNRLETFESGKRIEMYMLLAKQLSVLPPPQQIHLINGRGWD
ncbi:MAG TPA: hypothetical protein VF797_07420, partial [Noviherbaspirillum sp.]